MKRFMVVAALALALAVPVSAQAVHPSFAGTWVLDPAKTINNTGGEAPDGVTRTVVQHGDTLVVDTEVASSTLGPQHTHLVWGLDGKAWKNTIAVAGTTAEVSTVLSWDGSTLVTNSSLSVVGIDVTQVDRWVMAADGKSIVATRAITQNGEDAGNMTMTFNKKN
jgi:hypothetical protein